MATKKKAAKSGTKKPRKRATRRRANPIELPVIALNPSEPRRRRRRRSTKKEAAPMATKRKKARRTRRRRNPGPVSFKSNPRRPRRRRRNPEIGSAVKPIAFGVGGALAALAAGYAISSSKMEPKNQKYAIGAVGLAGGLLAYKYSPAAAAGLAGGSGMLVAMALKGESDAKKNAALTGGATVRRAQFQGRQVGGRKLRGIDDSDVALGLIAAELGDIQDDDDDVSGVSAELGAVDAQLGAVQADLGATYDDDDDMGDVDDDDMGDVDDDDD